MVEIDPERLERTFDRYAEIGATDDGGLHRLALTDADREVRDLLVSDLEALDLSVRVDELGNVFGRREGSEELPPVLVGSHLDSQPSGGRFDGQLGVLAALETLRALDDAGIETRRPIELVNWTNEEGARFPTPMLGSGVATGQLDREEMLDLADDDGKTIHEELERIGYDGDASVDLGDVYAALELHVEQGPKLGRSGHAVGIVEGVFGMAWLDVTITGESNHAGPTPMDARSDALAAATDAISELNRLPNRLSADAVTTVGRIDVEPDSINVIPDEATFTVDVRSYDESVVERGVAEIEAEIAAACRRHGTEYELDELWRIPPMEFSERVRGAVADAAEAIDADARSLVSGAGHDAKYLDDVTDAGMVFVPSVDGITHNEDEYTDWADVVTGTQVVAEAARRLAEE